MLYDKTIQIKTVSSYNTFGEVTLSSATNYTARTHNKKTKLISETGDEIVASGIAYISGTQSITTQDYIIIDSVSHNILGVEKYDDISDLSFTKVYY